MIVTKEAKPKSSFITNKKNLLHFLRNLHKTLQRIYLLRQKVIKIPKVGLKNWITVSFLLQQPKTTVSEWSLRQSDHYTREKKRDNQEDMLGTN
jgi:hypothetical protein